METSRIQSLAGVYRLSPDKRPQILRKIYKSDGKVGIQAFVRILGNKSAEPFIKWANKDYKNTIRSRRGQKFIKIGNPPSPPGNVECNINVIFEDTPISMGGYKLGRQGGKRNILGAQAWDAVQRG